MISIVILNYNSTKYTVDCINSILNSDYENYEIIVVDNASKNESYCQLIDFIDKLTFEKIVVVRNRINFGFALGNITGIEKAEGDYIFVLNNDTLVDRAALKTLSLFMEERLDISLCIPAQYNEDGTYHPSFNYLPSILNQWLGNGFCRLIDRVNYPDRKKLYEKPIRVQMGSGASMFFRKDDYYRAGGFDPNYFLYCEEEDICIRMRDKGMSIYFVPEAKITHFCGGSTKRNVDIEKEFYISLFYFLNKNYGFMSALSLKLRFFIKEILRALKKPSKDRFELLISLLKSPSLSKSLRHRQCNLEREVDLKNAKK